MRDLNFFLSESTKKEKTNRPKLFAVALAMILIGAIALNSAFQVIKLRELQRDKIALDEELNDPVYMERLSEAQQKIAIANEMHEEQDFFVNLQDSMTKIHRVNEEIVHFLSKEMIDNLFLMELNIEDDTINLVGRALNKKIIAQFEYDLRHTGKFKEIRISEIKHPEEKDKYYDFTMTILTKDVMLDEA